MHNDDMAARLLPHFKAIIQETQRKEGGSTTNVERERVRSILDEVEQQLMRELRSTYDVEVVTRVFQVLRERVN